MQKLTDQIDQLLSECDMNRGDVDVDGYEQGLLAARRLAADHAKMQSEQLDNIAEVMGRLIKENSALTKQIDDGRFELSRSVLGLVAERPTDSLAQIVADAVEEYSKLSIEHVECGAHKCEITECECDCEECEPW